MKLLILGGTNFIGRHISATALANGHQITLFNRGQSNPNIFPEAEHLVGDRDGGLNVLRGKSWDAVIDVNGYVPRLVEASANQLKDHVNHYIYISTVGAYNHDTMPSNATEDAELDILEDTESEDVKRYYGGLKALCEKKVLGIFYERATILRLGLMAGPYDYAHRLYWIRRIAKGGNILVPTHNDKYFNFIDARDLAEFILLALKKPLMGIFNLGGNQSMCLTEWIKACDTVSGSNASFTYIDNDEFLHEHAIYDEIPFSKKMKHLSTCNDKAIRAGLHYRQLEQTAGGILQWDQSLPIDSRELIGLSAEKERETLDKWHDRQK